jgi:hypothetical protein
MYFHRDLFNFACNSGSAGTQQQAKSKEAGTSEVNNTRSNKEISFV